MRLNKNYFLLYHGINLDRDNPIYIDAKINDETFFELAALLLAINQKNFEKIKLLKSFNDLILLFTSKKIETMDAMHHLQYSIIEHFIESRSMLNIQHLHLSFNYLLEEKILKQQEHDKLISLFDPTLFEKKLPAINVDIGENFHTNKQAFIVSLNELKEITQESEALEKIENISTLSTFL